MSGMDALELPASAVTTSGDLGARSKSSELNLSSASVVAKGALASLLDQESEGRERSGTLIDSTDKKRYVCRCIPILNPREDVRARWDLVVIFMLLYNLIEIPIRVCFDEDAEPWGVTDSLNLVVDIFFMIDVGVNFCTGFYQDEFYVDEPRKIAQRYFRTWFWLDVLTSIPFSHIFHIFISDEDEVSNDVARFIRIGRLLKLFRFAKLIKTLGSWEAKAGLLPDVLKTIKFVMTFFFIGHFFACLWMLLAVLARNDDGTFHEDTWPARLGYVSKDDLELELAYLLTIYWSFSTVTTVGYGDIKPYSQAELIFSCVVMFTGACAFGYIIGNVSTLVSFEDAGAERVRDKIKSINDYMRYRKLPMSLQKRIRAHFEYSWRRRTVYDERAILRSLPTHLRTKLATSLFAQFLERVPFLMGLGHDCISLLVTELVPLQVAPNTFLFKRGALGNEMYFINHGAVEVINRHNKTLVELSTGAYFGEKALIATRPHKRSVSVRTMVFTDFYSLAKKDFERVIELYPNLRMVLASQSKEQMVRRIKNFQGPMSPSLAGTANAT